MNQSFMCKQCNKILNSISQYEDHLKSEGHEKQVNLVENSSKLVSETGKFETDQYIQKYGTGYKCLACDVVMNSITTARSHAYGQKHLKSIRNYVYLSDCGIATGIEDKLKVNPTVCITEDSSKLVSESGIFETDQYIEKYGTGYKCLACNVVMNSSATAQSHAYGQKHLKTIRNNMDFSDSGIATTSSSTLSDSDNLDIIDQEFSLRFIDIEDLLKEIKVIQVNDPIEF